MIVKRIVILANSIKNQNRCIAGRELWHAQGAHRLGKWVRPVTSAGHGEIALDQSTLTDGTQPAVMDIIDVPLLDYADDPTQPENWHLAVGKPWKRVTTVPGVPQALLREAPANLWIEFNQDTDRISAAAVAAMTAPSAAGAAGNASTNVGPAAGSASLYLIQPRRFRLVARTERDGPYGKEHRRRRAVFEYGRERYNLSVTDPTIDARYLDPFPTAKEGPRKVELPCGDDCLLCVSRTPVYEDGCHYKIVATVMEGKA